MTPRSMLFVAALFGCSLAYWALYTKPPKDCRDGHWQSVKGLTVESTVALREGWPWTVTCGPEGGDLYGCAVWVCP
jgi:hypothetical protein